jgi:hypothetical protein
LNFDLQQCQFTWFYLYAKDFNILDIIHKFGQNYSLGQHLVEIYTDTDPVPDRQAPDTDPDLTK